MNKHIFILILLGIVLCFRGDAFGQPERVANGQLPYRYLDLKIVPIHDKGPMLYIWTPGRLHWRHQQLGWRYSYVHAAGDESFQSALGSLFIYDNERDSLAFRTMTGWDGRDCPGRPQVDFLDNIHIIWGDTQKYYGFSTDTLSSFSVIDTLPPELDFIYLVTSPNDSLIGALFYNSVNQHVVKYLSTNGNPIDFSEPADTIDNDGSILNTYDLTIDNRGEIFYLYNWSSGYMWSYHYAWSEEFGSRFIEYSTDDVNDCPGFEFIFGPDNGEVLLISSGHPPHGGNPEFFASPDWGDTWYKTFYANFAPNGFYGSSPRAYADIIHFVYFTTYPDQAIYYIPILPDSVFDNLTSIDKQTLVPLAFSLSNHPNPFNAQTTITYALSSAADIRIGIFDIQGRKVGVITDGNRQAGEYKVIWDASGLPSGVYFARLEAGERAETIKLVLLK